MTDGPPASMTAAGTTTYDREDNPVGMIAYEVRDDVAWITLNAPERLNALDLGGWNGITDALARAAEETRAPVVLTGAGRAFCAGDDIRSFGSLRADREAAREFFLAGLYRTIEAIVLHPTPVIAAVNGPAYGGGLELVAASDIAIGASSSSYCIPEGRIGAFATVFVGLASTVLPLKQAARFAFTMQPWTPAEALSRGILSDTVDDAGLRARVDETVAEIRRGSYDSSVQTKRFLTAEVREVGLPRVFAALNALIDEVLPTRDLAEGTEAFLAKREPEFVS